MKLVINIPNEEPKIERTIEFNSLYDRMCYLHGSVTEEQTNEISD